MSGVGKSKDEYLLLEVQKTDSLSKTAMRVSRDEDESCVSCVSRVAIAFGYTSFLMCESVLTICSYFTVAPVSFKA